MHELSVTENILQIALNHAVKEQAMRVTDVHLVIGQLSSIVDDSVQFYWDIITKDTLCEASCLHFTRKDAVFVCNDCGTEYSPGRELAPCPNCGSVNLKIIAGEEFYLDSIQIER